MIILNHDSPPVMEQKTHEEQYTSNTPSALPLNETTEYTENVQTFSLEDMRKKSGLTGAVAADLCNTTYRSLRNWETGVSVPNIINVLELLAVYGFTIEQLDTAPFYKGISERTNVKKNEQANLALNRLHEMRSQNTPDAP